MSHDFIHYLKSVFETDLCDLFQTRIMPEIGTKQIMTFVSQTAASFRVSTHLNINLLTLNRLLLIFKILDIQ